MVFYGTILSNQVIRIYNLELFPFEKGKN
jgi:hypothetical protein